MDKKLIENDPDGNSNILHEQAEYLEKLAKKNELRNKRIAYGVLILLSVVFIISICGIYLNNFVK